MDERMRYEDSEAESWPTAKIDTILGNCGERGDAHRPGIGDISHDLI